MKITEVLMKCILTSCYNDDQKLTGKTHRTCLYKVDNQIHCWPQFCCCKFLLDIDVL